jgi:hypothetical protein
MPSGVSWNPGELRANYISAVAAAIRAEVPGAVTPDEPHLDRLFRMYALLALSKGLDTTAEDVHNAWVAWMVEIDSDHPALCPYSELSSADQEQDEPYLTAIHRVSGHLLVEVDDAKQASKADQ